MSMPLPVFKFINLIFSDGKKKGLSNQQILDTAPQILKDHYADTAKHFASDGYDVNDYFDWAGRVYERRLKWASPEQLSENDVIPDDQMLEAIWATEGEGK